MVQHKKCELRIVQLGVYIAMAVIVFFLYKTYLPLDQAEINKMVDITETFTKSFPNSNRHYECFAELSDRKFKSMTLVRRDLHTFRYCMDDATTVAEKLKSYPK